jgi:plasmid stabilization system protein ParE
MSEVDVTQVAAQSLNMLSRYMVEFVGPTATLTLVSQLLNLSQQRLSDNPLQFPLCHELERLGVTDYRQITVDKYKILYRYDPSLDKAFITAFMRQKQSAQQLLIDYTLLSR